MENQNSKLNRKSQLISNVLSIKNGFSTSLILYLTIVCLTMNVSVNAQKMSDTERLTLAVWIPDDIENMPLAASSMLENKLIQVATQNGITGSTEFSRFVLTANAKVLTKDITATTPPMHAYTLNINLYIGDGVDGKAFSSYSTTVKGVGSNETKAYLAAIKNMRTNDPNYQSFIDKGKSKIIAYFNAQCDFIIKNAQTLAGMNKFDEAIWNLTSIPDICPDCWNKAMDAVAPIFKQKIDFECKEKLNMAHQIWNAGQSWDAANNAGALMATIDPNASCVGEIKVLANKIEKRIKEVDNREWKFIYDYNITLKRDMIKAYRDVGVAWGRGQKATYVYRRFW